VKFTRRECLGVIIALGGVSACSSPASNSSGQSSTPAKGPDPTSPSPSPSPITPSGPTFTPEEYGAVGDGQANDTDAFAKMAAAVNKTGGGTIVLRMTTYLVGKQGPDPTSPYAFAPAQIMELDGCTQALTILGNGARLKCADGLRFGTFSPATGLATQHPVPFYDVTEVASPYRAMITVQNCKGKVRIENVELDGNLANLVVGGPYGDTGRQIPATGLRLLNNSGGEYVVGVHSHHHALDGVLIDNAPDRTATTTLENVTSEYNARQGCSIVGGRNYNFLNCKFNHTGKAALMSAPGAGVDIESEVNPIRNLSFSGCEFSNNSGVGMLADSGDTDSATFDTCRFVGTTSWSAWPCKPHFRFNDCQFVGAIVQTFGATDPKSAVQFTRCSFVDDPSLSPTGEVFGTTYTIADLGAGDLNVLFDSCRFSLKNNLVLPWSASSIYNNCAMSQLSSRQSYPRGTFTGVNTIDGNVDIYGSKVIGSLTINGSVIPPTG